MKIDEIIGKDIRVTAYYRTAGCDRGQVSSTAFVEEQHRKYAEERSWKISRFFSDTEKDTTQREQLLDECRNGAFDLVLCRSISHLDRDIMKAGAIMTEFEHYDPPVGILFETENIFSLDIDADFTLRLLTLLAEEESRQKSRRMTLGEPVRYARLWQSTRSPVM